MATFIHHKDAEDTEGAQSNSSLCEIFVLSVPAVVNLGSNAFNRKST